MYRKSHVFKERNDVGSARNDSDCTFSTFCTTFHGSHQLSSYSFSLVIRVNCNWSDLRYSVMSYSTYNPYDLFLKRWYLIRFTIIGQFQLMIIIYWHMGNIYYQLTFLPSFTTHISSKCFRAASFSLYLSHFLYAIPLFPISHLKARFISSNIWSQSLRLALATVLGGPRSFFSPAFGTKALEFFATMSNKDMSAN